MPVYGTETRPFSLVREGGRVSAMKQWCNARRQEQLWRPRAAHEPSSSEQSSRLLAACRRLWDVEQPGGLSSRLRVDPSEPGTVLHLFVDRAHAMLCL